VTRSCGKRPGAGRKPASVRRRVSHALREDFSRHHPLNITVRILDEVGHARNAAVFRAIDAAMLVVQRREDFRICHLSIQGNHLHIVGEADSRTSLSSGMIAFKTSAARRINKALGREGDVFEDRYHVEVIRSVAQLRNTICYVLNNWRKHGSDRGDHRRVDPYSTGYHFPGWAEPDIPKPFVAPPGADVLPYTPPRTWLLREGWKLATPISLFETPGRGATRCASARCRPR
jgi:REP element-mobilizing transposase RayT